MKLILLAFLAISALAHATEVAESELEHDWMWFPDGQGVPRLIDLKAEPENLDNDPLRNVDTITFNLYTRSNPRSAQVIPIHDANSIRSSNWNSGHPTRFIIHGWTSNGDCESVTLIRDAYLSIGDFNVIIVDWNRIAASSYNTAAGQVPNVASHVASFINFMSLGGGLDVSNTHVVGHSLGGHIAGISALRASGTIAAVVSLDPAMPLFITAGSGSGVHPNDAAYVQVIHTNGGTLGLYRTAGDADFYANGGRRQPGCGIDATGLCAHCRAYYYFAESITNPTGFRAADGVYMGGPWLSLHARGSYHFDTSSSSPFALG